jgi:predicted kinase
VQRVLVAGITGSGTSTYAEERFADPRYVDTAKVRFTRPATARRWMDVVAPAPTRQ